MSILPSSNKQPSSPPPSPQFLPPIFSYDFPSIEQFEKEDHDIYSMIKHVFEFSRNSGIGYLHCLRGIDLVKIVKVMICIINSMKSKFLTFPVVDKYTPYMNADEVYVLIVLWYITVNINCYDSIFHQTHYNNDIIIASNRHPGLLHKLLDIVLLSHINPDTNEFVPPCLLMVKQIHYVYIPCPQYSMNFLKKHGVIYSDIIKWLEEFQADIHPIPIV